MLALWFQWIKLNHMNALAIAVLIALVLGNPVLLLWTWVRRFMRGKSSALRWRIPMLWASMVLATAAVLTFWITSFVAPPPDPKNEFTMKIGMRLSLPLASAAFVAAMSGEGPERKWVAFSSLAVPFNWIMVSIWQ
jgi:hypothetical protein